MEHWRKHRRHPEEGLCHPHHSRARGRRLRVCRGEMEVEAQELGACSKTIEGDHRRTARDRTIIAKMDQYLHESDNMKVETEELELLLGPEESLVDLRCLLMNASNLWLAGSECSFCCQRVAMGKKKSGDGRKNM